MDGCWNRTSVLRPRRSLALLSVAWFAGDATAADRWSSSGPAWAPVQEQQTPDSVPSWHATRQVTLREPESDLPWSTVAGATMSAPRAPAPARIQKNEPSPPANSGNSTTFAANAGEQSVNLLAPIIMAQPVSTPLPPVRPIQNASAKRARDLQQIDFASIEVVEAFAAQPVASTAMPDSTKPPMPGFSVQALRKSAAQSLEEAGLRLNHRASLSAAQAATQALTQVTQSIDLRRGDGEASQRLESALMAIREADDFAGRYGNVDSAAVTRMVQSHQTKALKPYDTSQLTGLMAADLYLDDARKKLETIAKADTLAAHSIAILAKSYRQSANESPLALATSVHLMRAAVAAEPQDRGLALEFAGVLAQARLSGEAERQKAYAMTLPTPDQTAEQSVIAVVNGVRQGPYDEQAQQAVRIEQIAPELFAQVSSSQAGPTDSAGRPAFQPANQAAVVSPTTADTAEPAKDGNVMTRTFKSMTRWWR